jgi:hypothetical protein
VGVGVGATTAVVAVAALFASSHSRIRRSGSTAAAVVSVPAAPGAVTRVVIVALAPGLRAPPVQVTTPPAWAQTNPPVALADWYAAPAGSVCRTTIPVARSSPSLPTVRV